MRTFLFRFFLEISGFFVLILLAAFAIFLSAQCFALRDVLLQTSPGIVAALICNGALALSEALLPIAGLTTSALAFGRLRNENALNAWHSLGISSTPLYAAILALGLFLGLVTLSLGQSVIPNAMGEMGDLLKQETLSAIFTPGPKKLSEKIKFFVLDSKPRELWAILQTSDKPTILQAHLDPEIAIQQNRLELQDVYIWSKDAHLHSKRAQLDLSNELAHVNRGLNKRLAMFRAPNRTPSRELKNSLHERYTWHRRLAFPALAPIWCLLGALLGARFGAGKSICAAISICAFSYWLLRLGELAARAGFTAPTAAAWLPVAFCATICAWFAIRPDSQ